jgi:hypothetical protein
VRAVVGALQLGDHERARWPRRHPDGQRRRIVGIVDHAASRARTVGADAHVGERGHVLAAEQHRVGLRPNGTPYYAYFQPNGQERFREGDAYASGAWRVLPDGRLCTQLARFNGGAEQCYVLSHSGNVVTFQSPDGTQAGSFTLVSGNPQGL